jgi:hypothetical protein
MNPVRIVLANDEIDEHELTVCNQGTVFTVGILGLIDVVDVASSEVVAQQSLDGWRWGDAGPYDQLFVHAVDGTHHKLTAADIDEARRDGDETHDILLEPWSTRTLNLMKRRGFKTVEEIAENTERYIAVLSGVGTFTIEEIRMSLNSYGLDYREET